MSGEEFRALRLLSGLVEEFDDPGFVWPFVVLLGCLALAWGFARRWQRTHGGEGVGRLRQVGSRLAFPLSATLLVGVALLVLKPFFPVSLLRLALPLLGALALVRAVAFVLRQAFPGAAWLAAGERTIAGLVWLWLALHITDLAPYVVAALEDISFPLGRERLSLWTVLSGLVTIFLTVVFALWIAGVIETRLMRMQGLEPNLRIVGVRITKAVLTVVAILASLSLVGIDITALSVFTGALGVGLGLGLQKIASNYVSGFIILLERSIRIGNIVQVNNEVGEVTQITTRYTVLRHPGGTEFIVPNETLVGSTVQNQTYSDKRMRLSTTVGVAYDSDLELAMRLLADCAQQQERVLADPAPAVLLTQFADSSINLELGFWIADPENGRMNLVSAINLAIWHAFRQHGIQIPFPQREVRLLGEAAPTS